MSAAVPAAGEPTRPGGSVQVSRSGQIATITLSNPGRRNTMTERMWLGLVPVCRDLAEDPDVRVVVVRGDGTDFSAGADISDLDSILRTEESGRHDGGAVARGEAALAGLHKPTLAAVQGYCLGGAWQIAAACDIRLASSDATFGITPAKIGIVYPVAGIERLVRIAGPSTAKYLLFSGDFVDAERAHGLGLVQAVHPADTFWDDVDDFAQRLASRSQLSIQAMKDIVDVAAAGGDLAPVSDHWQEQMAASQDPAIGARAFLAKQTPRFTWNGGPDSVRRPGTRVVDAGSAS
ncbi:MULTISPECIES: enoyl-CoA hydratase/isomerase family protein [Micrococcaceae]|uniref:enoyl-CoA hydratase/isomerase family protein n=1 Tax=Micrococcaceae TaxID=1268 RepID=UPI00160C6E72|nr:MULTISPECIES: enoyl-CoA hydratase/isomerase family protein [Micrococcaceae]MBB5750657.1 enoyl-CoA hydratase/carnithine racemase [Micrococcus sp. TA1]HRO30888.1 enoyl-CoA hydratase/isomerase family protein [Citricoccus sp.]HRO92952.1 enoyl-CoA hydratase/isomerase family protein [Citricoccus sp.]